MFLAAERRLPCSRACFQVCAVGSLSSAPSYGRFGVTRSARYSNRPKASSAPGSSSRSPLVAIITGSNTTTWATLWPSHASTSSMIAALPSIPVLKASIVTSSLTAASCSR